MGKVQFIPAGLVLKVPSVTAINTADLRDFRLLELRLPTVSNPSLVFSLEFPAPPEEKVLLTRQSSEGFSSFIDLNVTESSLFCSDLSWRKTHFLNLKHEIGTSDI